LIPLLSLLTPQLDLQMEKCLDLEQKVGISTQKLHVRGPMGLEALTTERYVVTTEGITRK